MSVHPNNPDEKQVPCAGLKEKENKLESAMVKIGMLVTYQAASAVKGTLYAAASAVKKINGFAVPLRLKFKDSAKKSAKGFARFRTGVSSFTGSFKERASRNGFFKALALQAADAVSAVKGAKSRRIAKTFVNHAVPVLSIAFLVFTVSEKASADYGVTVEINGQELGVVSEASVIEEAQKVIADRAVYYDTASETYITAALTLKPLGEQDEVIDEQTLADVIQEQIDILPPVQENEDGEANEAGEAVVYGIGGDASDNGTGVSDGGASDFIAEETDNRVRAYPVTVNGEFIGAVEGNSDIEKFLEGIKEKYAGDGVLSVDFDKDIEYTYEQYVDPADIVDQQNIINILDSNVEEPVFYVVQQGDNPWNIARNNDMSVDDLKNCFITYDGEKIDDITSYCPVGAVVQLSEEVPYLQVTTTSEVTYNEVIDYETETSYDDDMYKGESKVDVKGVEGEKEVTAFVTYKNGVAVKREVISEKVLSYPVTKKVRMGTRETRTPVSEGSGGSGDYFWPVDGGYISAYQGDGRGHKGIDIAAPYGTPIYAAESGTVTETGSGWNGGYGNCVKISHDDGNVTVYAHQSSIAIKNGDYVVKGQIIGYVGSTGDSTGNHLHFEVRSNGTYVNPTKYVSQY